MGMDSDAVRPNGREFEFWLFPVHTLGGNQPAHCQACPREQRCHLMGVAVSGKSTPCSRAGRDVWEGHHGPCAWVCLCSVFCWDGIWAETCAKCVLHPQLHPSPPTAGSASLSASEEALPSPESWKGAAGLTSACSGLTVALSDASWCTECVSLLLALCASPFEGERVFLPSL